MEPVPNPGFLSRKSEENMKTAILNARRHQEARNRVENLEKSRRNKLAKLEGQGNPVLLSIAQLTSENSTEPKAQLTVFVPKRKINSTTRKNLDYFTKNTSSSSSSDEIKRNQDTVPFTFHTLNQLPKYDITTTNSPPLPPAWAQICDEIYSSSFVTNIRHVPVDPSSTEYKVLNDLIQPCPISIQSIQKVVNLELWKKFVNYRKERLILNSTSLESLVELGVPENERLRYINLNSSPNYSVENAKYADNIALLFHGTKNIGDVLVQGLDERVSSHGRLGRGLYFTDDPNKALRYDQTKQTLLIFAVFLGDCLALEGGSVHFAKSYTREPLKKREQQRNQCDLFFDSIVARPKVTSNEFVIFNRYQCVPLYVVTYTRTHNEHTPIFTTNVLQKVREKLPPFAWINGNPPPKSRETSYPFFAQTVFKLMDPSYIVKVDNANLECVELEEVEESENHDLALNLSKLADLGFLNVERNTELFKKYGFDLVHVVDKLLEDPAPSETPGENSNPMSSSCGGEPEQEIGQDDSNFSETMDFENQNQEDESCPICMDDFPKECSRSWKKLSTCTHKLCSKCYKEMTVTRKTMAGISYSFLKCPVCNACSGIQIGTCPDGTMNFYESNGHGHQVQDDSWTVIQYNVQAPFPNHHKTVVRRTAYLPNTTEGKEALELLQIAWDRRLIFSIGTSATTGKQNAIVWNIHHKTAKAGGPLCYGFPDPTYFHRLKEELATFGIKSSISEVGIEP